YLSNGGSVGKVDGTDILFTAADGVTKLNHEIESYNPGSGGIEAWVQIPNLSVSTDTAMFLYYGNAAVADQQNKAGAWDSSYRLVSHFAGTPVLADSTQYGNHGMTSAGQPALSAGVAGNGYAFDGTGASVAIPYSASWNGPFNSYAVEFWIKLGAVQDYRGAM